MNVYPRLSSLVAGFLLLGIAPAVAAQPGGRVQEKPRPAVRAVAFSPDGKLLAAASATLPQGPGAVSMWELASIKQRWTRRHDRGYSSLAFAPDGRMLAIGGSDSNVKLLDVATGQVIKSLSGNGNAARGVAFSPNGRTLAVSSNDSLIRLWDISSGTIAKTLKGHTGRVYCVAFSPDGNTLASAGVDAARLWDVAGGHAKHVLAHNGFLVSYALFCGEGRQVLTGGWDGSIRLWDVETGTLRIQAGKAGGVHGLALNPAGKILASCGGGKTVDLFDVAIREPSRDERDRIRTLLVQLGSDDYDAREAAGSALLKIGLPAERDLRREATESTSAEVRIRCRRLLGEFLSMPKFVLKGHQTAVECIAFSPDGTLLASASRDGSARLWSLATQKEIAQFVPGEEHSKITGH